MKDIALVTYQSHPALSASDQGLVSPLQALGFQAAAVPWDAPNVDWQRFAAVILRSCWDYHMRPHEFRQWIAQLEEMSVPLFNTAPTVLWNMDKTYLRTLAQHGIKTIPTVWATQDNPVSLSETLAAQGWQQAVLKPTIGASADGIRIVSQANAEQSQASFETLMNQGTVMIQPLLEEIREGELSLIFFNSALSHVIRKLPGQGTIFVNTAYGGSYTAVDVDAHIVQTAQHILHAALPLAHETSALYARVDGVMVDGEFILMELELIEPSLFLDPASAARFASAIKSVVEERL